jgi:hypothetical protein
MRKQTKDKKDPIFDKNEGKWDETRGRRIICTCDIDEEYCEIHNEWA